MKGVFLMQNDQEDDIFYEPITHMNMPVALKAEATLTRGKWFLRIYVVLNLLRALYSIVNGASLIWEIITILCFVFLYRGVLWLRIVLSLTALIQCHTLYQIYHIIYAFYGFNRAAFLLPFMLLYLLIPCFLFLQPSVVAFLREQRNKNYPHLA